MRIGAAAAEGNARKRRKWVYKWGKSLGKKKAHKTST